MSLTVPTENVRNVLLLGHSGTGKTTLAEAMLHATGLITRMGEPGATTLDHEPEERDRARSLGLAMAAIPWRGHKLNVLDAAGGVEAVGDAYPALHAADVAVFVVDATAGIQAQHIELWSACEAIDLPRIVFLNKLDLQGAGFQVNVDALREAYGKQFAPVQMPLGIQEEFTGVIDLLHFIAVEFTDGERVEEDVPEERREQAERNREFLVESIVETDDDLLVRYLDGETPDVKELADRFGQGVAGCDFFPLLCGSAERSIGVTLLMEFLIEECPSPAARGRVVGADGTERAIDGPLTLYVAKTLSDPYVGHINVLRVLAGNLEADDTVVDARTGDDHRLHQLFTLRGKEQLPVDRAPAGDVVAVAKLDDVRTGDVLHAKGADFAIEATEPPQGYYRVALKPASQGDEEKLSTALTRLSEEDTSIALSRHPDTGQIILTAYGPSHVDVTLSRLKRKFGVAADQSPPPIAYRETVKGAADGIGKHVKQTGGHGQYGVASIRIAPLSRGAGFEFEDKITGGVIPSQFIPSVEKGVREAMQKGSLAGFEVVDIKVTVVDGKHHSVDSSDAAFQMAGILAFRDACRSAGMKLLEPIMEVDVVVPDELTGSVMGDLSSRRGRILGTDPAGQGRTMVHAHVPEAELLSYPPELRALTSGQGTVAISYHHREDVPDHVAQRVASERADQEA